MDSGQDVILISSGGNDVGFADIINQCVYQFFSPTKILGTLGEIAYDRAALKEWLAKAATRVGLDGVDIPLPDIDLMKYARTCEEELENSKKMIDSPEFSKGITDLINKAKEKLAPGGRIYYTSYAQFWSPDATDDDWCADPKHTWSVFLSVSAPFPLISITLQLLTFVENGQRCGLAIARCPDRCPPTEDE